MLLYYIRHGHPTYEPDALTPLGRKEAEAVAKRLAVFGVDRVFSSSSTRAMETAKPTCDLVGKELTVLDFAHESLAWADLAIPLNEKRKDWVFLHPEMRKLLVDPEVLALGENWHRHPKFQGFPFEKGLTRIRTESDRFLASLGYEHLAGRGLYRAVSPNDERVAFFAHGGFGLAFLSCLLDIPYPRFSMHFDLSHSGITVIEFPEENGFSVPRICTLSSDAHLYREGLPTEYNGRFRY